MCVYQYNDSLTALTTNFDFWDEVLYLSCWVSSLNTVAFLTFQIIPHPYFLLPLLLCYQSAHSLSIMHFKKESGCLQRKKQMPFFIWQYTLRSAHSWIQLVVLLLSLHILALGKLIGRLAFRKDYNRIHICILFLKHKQGLKLGLRYSLTIPYTHM